ncbi:MAG: SMP-30/gluconolactonase/LRE family protein [Rhizobiaceae bacterium]|nr:SMP-30/gluconolactonase/LRE family protein [Rhizobiaceae bacterium]
MENKTEMAFEPLSGTVAELGESPVWSASENAVWWVDIAGKRLHRTSAEDGTTRSWPTPEQIGFVVLAARGPVVGMESGLFAFDPRGGAFERIYRLRDPGVRFNDATVDEAGRLWAGTMDIDNARPAGKLLRIDADLSVTEILSGFQMPNGIAVDAARSRLYVSDSDARIQTVWTVEIDFRTGTIGKRREFKRFNDLAGRPDGAALDTEGNYWIAGVDGGEIYRFSPEGEHLSTTATPMKFPTKMAFAAGRMFLTSKAGNGYGGRLVAAQTSIRGSGIAAFGVQDALVPG